MTADLILGALRGLFDIGWNTLPGPLVLLAALLASVSSCHALLNKRLPASALGWIAVSWMLPLYGVILYGLLGINRVRARARALYIPGRQSDGTCASPAVSRTRQRLVDIGDSLTGTPLSGGNAVTILENGNEAYPRMLAAIRTAKTRVWLATYIFETDECGREFVAALAEAAERGVQVRVLIDGIGERYSRPRASKLLEQAGVTTARFLPPRWLPPSVYINLRNHRKILCIDDDVAFTGGMNIGGRHLVDGKGGGTADVHFEVQGPVTEQLAEIFIQDWAFAAKAALEMPPDQEDVVAAAWCRTIVDGPDENLDRLRSLMVAAVNNANEEVRIMSPYFLPTADLVSAMATAALAGVRVTVILPSDNNLPFVQWAMQAVIPRLQAQGIRFWVQPPPFSHAKLFLVDEEYALVGSANIDARSLRLNYEIGLEIHDAACTGQLVEYFDRARASGYEIKRETLANRRLPWRVRDGAAWLMSPYL
ncbi:MAG: phospholipase D-like domain-containing protein [Pseudomonadota bacterium]